MMGNAMKVATLATGEKVKTLTKDGKDKAGQKITKSAKKLAFSALFGRPKRGG